MSLKLSTLINFTIITIFYLGSMKDLMGADLRGLHYHCRLILDELIHQHSKQLPKKAILQSALIKKLHLDIELAKKLNDIAIRTLPNFKLLHPLEVAIWASRKLHPVDRRKFIANSLDYIDQFKISRNKEDQYQRLSRTFEIFVIILDGSTRLASHLIAENPRLLFFSPSEIYDEYSRLQNLSIDQQIDAFIEIKSKIK